MAGNDAAASRRAHGTAGAQTAANTRSGAAWQAFVDAQTAHRNTMQSGPWQRQQQAQMNAPEYFNNRVQFMEQRLTSLQNVAKAAGDLYATLTPEQQTVMNDFLASRPGGYGRKAGAAKN
jgi:hypothetical protein